MRVWEQYHLSRVFGLQGVAARQVRSLGRQIGKWPTAASDTNSRLQSCKWLQRSKVLALFICGSRPARPPH